MRRDLSGAIRFLVIPTFALVLIAGGAPGRLGLAARVYALIVCGVGLVVVLRALQRTDPPETPLRAPVRRLQDARRPPSSLARLEQLAALGVASSFDLQYRFLPQLRSIGAGLLASRRRVDLDSQQDAAREILGEETWELVRPARPAPRDRIGRGITPAQLSHVAESLERI